MLSLIREQQQSHAVARLCRVLEVKVPVQRLKLIAELKRWFGLSLGSAGQRTLVSLLATADFKVSRQLPQHKYAKSEQGHLCIPNVLGRTCKPDKPNQAGCILLSLSTCSAGVSWVSPRPKALIANALKRL